MKTLYLAINGNSNLDLLKNLGLFIEQYNKEILTSKADNCCGPINNDAGEQHCYVDYEIAETKEDESPSLMDIIRQWSEKD